MATGKNVGLSSGLRADMNIQRVPVDKLKPAKYNPRKDLKPGDPAYEKIRVTGKLKWQVCGKQKSLLYSK